MATIPEALAIAVQHHQAGRLQVAEQIYRQILSVDPNHADALHLVGVIASQVGQYEIAVEYIGRAIRLQGNADAFHRNLAGTYYALRRYPEAVTCYRRALELKPDHAQSHYKLGNVFRLQGNLDEAVACYRRALELEPDYVEAHNNLGLVLKNQGKLDEAAACCRRALELMPDSAEIYNNLGEILKDQESMAKAVDYYRKALQLKPDFTETHYNLGCALEEMGDFRARRRPSAQLCSAIPALLSLITNWRNSYAAIFRKTTSLRNAACYRKRTWRMRNDCCCTSAWPRSWTRGANMPRPPSISNAAMRCNWRSGASAARSTTRKRTNHSSPG